jgi:DNA (cytosine-5)-methyltransferase 1
MKKSITWYQDREPVILQRDIRTLTTKEILDAGELAVGETFVISGGPPCQGFSTANITRCIDDPRNFLFKEFVEL